MTGAIFKDEEENCLDNPASLETGAGDFAEEPMRDSSTQAEAGLWDASVRGRTEVAEYRRSMPGQGRSDMSLSKGREEREV